MIFLSYIIFLQLYNFSILHHSPIPLSFHILDIKNFLHKNLSSTTSLMSSIDNIYTFLLILHTKISHILIEDSSSRINLLLHVHSPHSPRDTSGTSMIIIFQKRRGFRLRNEVNEVTVHRSRLIPKLNNRLSTRRGSMSTIDIRNGVGRSRRRCIVMFIMMTMMTTVARIVVFVVMSMMFVVMFFLGVCSGIFNVRDFTEVTFIFFEKRSDACAFLGVLV